MNAEVAFSVSDFVAVFNQTISYAYPVVTIIGELANFRVSKNRWVYFDLKDETASVKFFGTVYNLKGPLEEGMLLKVSGTPQLHQQFGFSITVQSIELSGEGTIQRAARLLEAKLQAEGLFETARKRHIAFPPAKVGLITSAESAAYTDFIKILNERWGGVEIQLCDVLVQGEDSPRQIVDAVHTFNSQAEPPDILVITRGGGSADDLQAFSTEQVTRAVAASRIPTLVAIGHERDLSLAELAADYHASTPSNAAQILVPEREQTIKAVHDTWFQIMQAFLNRTKEERQMIHEEMRVTGEALQGDIQTAKHNLQSIRQLLNALKPDELLRRGFAIVRSSGKVVKSVKGIKNNTELSIQLQDGTLLTQVKGKVQ
jgi:exodeoxyribonuclease VII large subunit